MNSGTQANKLFELRAKTDRQLAALVTTRLDSALRLACSEGHQAGAESIYHEVSALVPWVGGLTQAEQDLLQSKMARLRRMLSNCAAAACP